MKLEGKLFRANLVLKDQVAQRPDTEERFVIQLEKCLVDLCHQLEIPIPLWLEKNTREFARFHQTMFFADQFTEKIYFDRLQIRWLK